MKKIPFFQCFLAVLLITQYSKAQDWDGFSQNFDVTAYQGGEFRFKGFVRANCANGEASARLMARVDKKKGYGFLDNMKDRPITTDSWNQYIIEGKIDNGAQRLFIGAMYLGKGKFYFDNFSVDIKGKNGNWEKLDLVNPGFEEQSSKTDWKSFFDLGFETHLVGDNPSEGSYCLLVNTNIKSLKGKFVSANGINIHYETYGKGDTILLLHGNSMSIDSFSMQIPVLEKQFFVVAVDSRGQGNTTKDDRKITYELIADDVNSLLDKLNYKNVNVFGWSDGGNIGLILAMNHPDKVKRLAIMGANLFNNNTSIRDEINDQLKKEKEQLIKQKRQNDMFRIEMIDLLLNEPKINPDSLNKIKCPTLVMAGSKDVIKENHTKLIASKISRADLVIFEKGTHFEPWENPERFNKTLMEFFDRK